MKILEFGACEYASGEKQWPIARDYCVDILVRRTLVDCGCLHRCFSSLRTFLSELRLKTGTDLQTGGHLEIHYRFEKPFPGTAEERFPTHGPRCTTDPPRGRAIHSFGHSGHKTCRHPSVNPFVLLLLFTPHHRRPIVRRSPVGHPRSGQRANSNQFDGRSVGHHRHDHPTTFGTFIAPTQRHV